jgi:hypothetical protein
VAGAIVPSLPARLAGKPAMRCDNRQSDGQRGMNAPDAWKLPARYLCGPASREVGQSRTRICAADAVECCGNGLCGLWPLRGSRQSNSGIDASAN